ncbi:DUF1501 domain-containing protein [Haloferula sp.]|uniref:DUF1501 domain-containing protein n=1 Tax=Haloferula sp. TaxID=2497595 RepID=UPI003C71048E
MKSKPSEISRRSFLGHASCAGISATPLISTLLNLKLANIAAAQGAEAGDYKALVCIFLAGGNDSFNTLIPRNPTRYADYTASRSDLALSWDPAANEIINLYRDGIQQWWGVHSAMPEVADLFDSERLSFLANVGTLTKAGTDIDDFSGKVNLPRGLFSHSDQQQQWQTSVSDNASRYGWSGRIADLLRDDPGQNANYSMNISLGGNNIWQNGANTTQYQITSSGSIGRSDILTQTGKFAMLGGAVNSQLDQNYVNLFEKSFASISKEAIDVHEDFKSAVGQRTFTTPFPVLDASRVGENGETFGAVSSACKQLEEIARTIAAHNELGMRRQTFFVKLGGYDTHSNVLPRHAELMNQLSRCLGYFDSLMTELGMQDNVTTFTSSDFGRSLGSNSGGSDHGWGGNQIITGGAVNGGIIHGNFPNLSLGAGNPLDTGRGRLIPTTSVDQYFQTLAHWFGVSPSDMPSVLPNIGEFYSGSDAALPFMKAI